MRVKLLLAVVFSIALAAAATSAFAAAGGQPGKPDDPGKSAEAPGHNKEDAEPSDSSKDPSNPDGTYQGKSPSTPDQDGIGADHGIDNNDKTGPGTDGNNGCGNDPDREDDNNGWCGTPEVSPTETPTVNPSVSPSPTAQAQVLGVKIVKPEAEVLGLALTGAGLVIPIALGSALLMMGLGIRAISKQPRF